MSTDALIMLRRNFKHTARNPVTVFNAVLLPVVIMLMFVYLLGNAFSVGVKYIDYATPGMILLAVAYGLGATATEVNDDMTKGIINRFRVMDVSRGAVMTGHVVVTVLRSLAGDVPPCKIDSQKIEQVFINLLTNAAQASAPDEPVTVVTRLEPGSNDRCVEISVIDRGSGIPPEKIEAIFNPFFTTKQDGVGLGLAIVTKIVDGHGGKMTVDSEPGKGSTFRIGLPI